MKNLGEFLVEISWQSMGENWKQILSFCVFAKVQNFQKIAKTQTILKIMKFQPFNEKSALGW